ncbi:MAG: sigma factor [Lachnospiraceae bacterium]
MKTEKEKLIIDNIGLAYKWARVLAYYSLSWEDRLSIAFMGLVEAAIAYDESKGIEFGALAYTVIKRKMIKEMKQELKHKDTYSLNKPFENLDGEDLTLMDVIPDTETGFNEVDLSDLTRRMQSLPKEQRIAVDLIVCQGMKPKKVSKIMRRRESWIDNCVQQGVNTLKTLYLGGYKICK